MIELELGSANSSNPRLTIANKFDELSNYLGRYIKIEGIPVNSQGNRGNLNFCRAGKLIAVCDYKEKNRGSTSPSDAVCGIIVEGFQKVDMNLNSTTLVISVLQSDAGIWKVIHEPKRKKNK